MKPHKSIQIFSNPFLEKLTHVHPITPFVLWSPIISFMLWRAYRVHHLSAGSILAVGGIALLVWTLSEYLLHRFVFHFTTEGVWQERLQFLIHGLHHADPVDPTRLVMPPVPALILFVPVYFFFRVILGRVWIDPFLAFFLVGYLGYDYIHYGVHHFSPKSRLGKWIKQNHMLHHYVNPESRWGVSTPIWDYVFGTYKESEKKRHAV